jgi:hypothetical protein
LPYYNLNLARVQLEGELPLADPVALRTGEGDHVNGVMENAR